MDEIFLTGLVYVLALGGIFSFGFVWYRFRRGRAMCGPLLLDVESPLASRRLRKTATELAILLSLGETLLAILCFVAAALSESDNSRRLFLFGGLMLIFFAVPIWIPHLIPHLEIRERGIVGGYLGAATWDRIERYDLRRKPTKATLTVWTNQGKRTIDVRLKQAEKIETLFNDASIPRHREEIETAEDTQA